MRRGWWVVVAGLILASGLSQLNGAEAKRPGDEEVYKELELFTDALAIVQSDYVEEPQAKDLIYGALKGMLATLDPYSQFLDPDSYNELRVETEGEFGGLGIEITIRDDLLTVIAPIDDTPAFRVGLLAGDRIVKIDGELTRGITLLEAVKKLRGRPQTKVTLTVLREGENTLKDFTITRDIIKIKSIREARLIEDSIGYIKLSDFRENTPRDLREAVERLRDGEMDSIILDLRNNPGGLLDVSIAVAELFLERRQLVVSTKGRLRHQNLELRTRIDGSINDIPMVVMINEGSASASEIVAGAIQDHHRGVVIGMKSHGKASVQTIFPLKDGSALRLTTSKYFTPSGRSIHGEGIMPDVTVPLERVEEEEKDQAQEIFKKIESEENGGAEGQTEVKAEEKDEPEFRIDNQLARAVDLLKGIRVYQASQTATP